MTKLKFRGSKTQKLAQRTIEEKSIVLILKRYH